MNPLIQEAAQSVQMVWVAGLMTVVFFVTFLAWVWYAYDPRHREMWDEAAQIPFADGGDE